MEKLKNIVSSLIGIPTLPKMMRNTLEKYKDAKIEKIIVYREPISKVAEGLLQLITLGKWKEIKGSYDDMFHLYAILYTDKGTLLLEKNETVVLKPQAPPKQKKGLEQILIDVPSPIPLPEFINKTIKRMTLEDYITYEGFTLNCQNFIKNHLLANQLLTPPALSFIYQDTKQLIEKTPSFSRWLGKAVTDVAGKLGELYEEVVYKRGGKVFFQSQGKSRRKIG